MDKYTVLKRIGVGTYGSAYLVSLKQCPEVYYVLKKIKVDQAEEKEKNQAETEVKVLLQLSHPLVLGYVDHFNYRGHLCIVTDYCEAGDLYQLLRARKTALPETQILLWFVQVVMAIQYVHQKSILHRDLKTQNIFLTKEGNIKLGDFGISRSLNSTVDLASTIIGTPYYMSPEVMSSMPYDFKSDMWSLGCVLYEMMSLKHAFDAADMSSLVMKILRGEHLPIPAAFSPELRDLAKQLLSKNPKLRPTPEAILKVPFLKEYVVRAREVIAQLDNQQAARHEYVQRRTSQNGAGEGNGNGHSGKASSAPNGAANIDRELELAKERLKRIQLERNALRGQAQHYSASNAMPAQPPPLVHARSVPSYASPPSHPHLQPGHVGHRPQGQTPELRHLRNSRPESPEMGQPPSPPKAESSDPKLRMQRRKEEEARRREMELKNARKAYFEERKQAANKLQQLYTPSVGTVISTGSTTRLTRRVTDSSAGQDSWSSPPHPHYSSPNAAAYPGLSRESSNPDVYSGHGITIDSSDDELDEPFSSGGNAQQEFEAELQQPGGAGPYRMAQNTFEAGGVQDRASALREICSYELGPQLFELIYGYVRKRMAMGMQDDQVFKQELMSRLGAQRMQYVHLIDQLIYFESMQGVRG